MIPILELISWFKNRKDRFFLEPWIKKGSKKKNNKNERI
jgi:hypothetical protein